MRQTSKETTLCPTAKTCDLMDGPLLLSVKDFVGKVADIATEVTANSTSEVVMGEVELHHAALFVDFDPVPFPEGGMSVPLSFFLPGTPAGRPIQDK